MNTVTRGARVRIAPEWTVDAGRVYLATDDCEGKGRVTITPVLWDYAIRPTEVIATAYLIPCTED